MDVIKSKLGRVEKHVANRRDEMTRHELIRNDLFVPPPTHYTHQLIPIYTI